MFKSLKLAAKAQIALQIICVSCLPVQASMLELFRQDDELANTSALLLRSCAEKGDGEESAETYRRMAACEARKQRLPPALARAVMEIESNFSPSASGGAGEVGLMQIMPGTARQLGFDGTLEELRVPSTNIRLGVRYLAEAYSLAAGDLCTAVMKYRAGHGESRFSHLSVNYCLRARAILTRDGYVVSGTVPVATFGYAHALGPIGRLAGGKRKNGVCIRRSFVPGPRYRACLVYKDLGTAKRIQILRSNLFTQ